MLTLSAVAFLRQMPLQLHLPPLLFETMEGSSFLCLSIVQDKLRGSADTSTARMDAREPHRLDLRSEQLQGSSLEYFLSYSIHDRLQSASLNLDLDLSFLEMDGLFRRNDNWREELLDG